MRACSNCDKKFNSVEKLLLKNITVIKRDGRRENFDENQQKYIFQRIKYFWLQYVHSQNPKLT